MITESWKRAMVPWLPMCFCAALSSITVIQSLWLTAMIGPNAGTWPIPFLCFLSMAFYFVGVAVRQV